MADSKITALTSISTSSDPANDPLVIVDVSDTSMAATGTTKKVTLNQLLATSPTATLASATITGDLTVDTSTLKVDSANNRVGIGTASPGYLLDVQAATAVAQILSTTGTNAAYLQVSNTGGIFYLGRENSAGTSFASPAYSAVLYAGGAYPLVTTVNGSERYRIASDGVATWSNVGGVAGTAMTLNANGLGIGVTPSAWGAGNKFIDINSSAAFGAFGASDAMMIGNAYWDGSSWIRKTANNAWRFVIESVSSTPTMTWQLAANGSAGSSISSWTQAMTLDASGRLLVGQTSTGLLNLNGIDIEGGDSNGGSYIIINHKLATVAGQQYAFFAYNGIKTGDITQNGTTGVLYNTVSDYRLKESVKPISNGLARVNSLKPSSYNWKSDGSVGEGFIAHELAEAVPAAVSGEKDALNADGSIKAQSVDMSRIIPILVAAIQELAAEVNALKKA